MHGTKLLKTWLNQVFPVHGLVLLMSLCDSCIQNGNSMNQIMNMTVRRAVMKTVMKTVTKTVMVLMVLVVIIPVQLWHH